ncbi:SagB family peptide dehydrogenase [Nocardia sp. NPDC057668]|uniref:SagB family peptide dehydrogenase n=1 Tax=Nocardia sp. NPDC057668 TaxID=3346202 RepID=UPI00366D667C
MSIPLEHTRYALRAGATRLLIPGGALLLNPPRQDRLTGLAPAQRGVVESLGPGPSTARELSGGTPSSEVTALLDRLAADGWLTITVSDIERDYYTLRPFGVPPTAGTGLGVERSGGAAASSPQTAGDIGRTSGPEAAPSGPGVRASAAAPAAAPAVLSKFALMHRDSDGLVLEHPTSWCDIRLHDPRLAAVIAGANPAELGLPATISARFAADLRHAGFTLADPAAEESTFTTRSWSAPDLWFHRRSTLGPRTLTWDDFGPTRWAATEFPPLPARRPPYPAPPLALPVPDLATLRATDPPLAAVLEDRRSHRAFDDAAPLTLPQLAELLYRTSRTRSVETTPAGDELPSRPYPSGGSVHELELYPVVRHVTGLPPAMYHYDSHTHALHEVAPADSPAVRRLLTTAAATLTAAATPQLLLVLAARAGRAMWTYEQVAYANTLKHAGVLTQTLYLAATAMNLGAVAQAFTDTAAFATATGVDELEECPVGSMVIGSIGR